VERLIDAPQASRASEWPIENLARFFLFPFLPPSPLFFLLFSFFSHGVNGGS